MKKMYEKLLDKLIAMSDENEVVEFKEAKNDFSKDKLGQYFSALSNESNLLGTDSAWLVFGVKDKTHEVVGTNFISTPAKFNELKHYMSEQISPSMSFRNIISLEKEGKRIIMFEIPSAPRGVPVSFKGHFYGREGESLGGGGGVSQEEIKRIFDQTAPDWSAAIVSEATLEDLDAEAIAAARKMFINKYPDKSEDVRTWDDITFLNKAKLTHKGKITRTTLLLVGSDDSSYYLSPAAPVIHWILRDENGLTLDHELCSIPFILSVDVVYNKIRNITYQYMREGTLIPEEVKQYDPFIIREALYNCIAHSDYTLGRRIDVIETNLNLSFINGGRFMPGSVESVVSQNAPENMYRNQFLVNAMINLKMVETAGGGIRKMFEI